MSYNLTIVKVMKYLQNEMKVRNPKQLEGIEAMQKEIRDVISQSKDDKQKLLD